MSEAIIHHEPLAEVPSMAHLPKPPPIGNRLEPYDRPRETFIAEGEGNGRFWRLSIRPGMSEGQYLGLMLQMWGSGQGFCREGQPHHSTNREHALDEAKRWIEHGR